MKKIVHFGKFYYPDAGGIENVTASLAKGAVQSGYNVSVVCFMHGFANLVEVKDGVKLIRAPTTAVIASQPLSWRYLKLCWSEGRDADLIHLHLPNMLAAVSYLILSKRIPLIVHWHSDVIQKGILGTLLRPLEKAILRRADYIVATSKIYADASSTLEPYANKITIVPIGVPDVDVELNSEADSTASLDALLLKIGNRRLILSVGRLVPYKGIEVLIRSAVTLQDNCVVVIVGGGALENPLKLLINDLGVSDKVYLAGRIPDSTLHSLFSRAAIYCMPSNSRAEAFGVVLLEAMAHGVPVVATNIPGSGVSWVNQHDVSGLNVPVNDPKALADACNSILESDDLYYKLSRGARERFLTEFTESKSVGKMMAVYRKALD